MGEWAENELARRHPEVFGNGNRHQGRHEVKFALPPGHWMTNEGVVLKFEDMTPTHRANCIAMLERKHGKKVHGWPMVKAMKKLGLTEPTSVFIRNPPDTGGIVTDL